MTQDSKQSLRLWLRLLSCSVTIEKAIRGRFIEQFETTLPRFDVMSALARNPDGITMGALTDLLLVSAGNVTGVVERLVQDGFATRTAARNDRRVQIVALTPEGRRYFQKLASAHEKWIDELFADIDDATSEQLLAGLNAVRDSVSRGRGKLQKRRSTAAKRSISA